MATKKEPMIVGPAAGAGAEAPHVIEMSIATGAGFPPPEPVAATGGIAGLTRLASAGNLRSLIGASGSHALVRPNLVASWCGSGSGSGSGSGTGTGTGTGSGSGNLM